MPVCGQCGKDNPEGLIYCGYCAAKLDSSEAVRHSAPSSPPPAKSGSYQSNPAPPRQFGVPIADPPASRKKDGIEWIPWRELSGGQKLGRLIVIGLVLLLVIGFIRVALDFALKHRLGPNQRAASANSAPLSAGDRKDGVQSLCKVFQIYGIPRSSADASAAAKNAQELFKLAGNESAGRSAFILETLAREFQSGRLKAEDCAAAGEALPSASNSTAPRAH